MYLNSTEDIAYYSTTLHNIVLNDTVQCTQCTALYCIGIHCTTLYYTARYYTALCWTMLSYTDATGETVSD